MGEIVRLRDYEPRQREATPLPAPARPAIVIVLPVIRIESEGWLMQQRRREAKEG